MQKDWKNKTILRNYIDLILNNKWEKLDKEKADNKGPWYNPDHLKYTSDNSELTFYITLKGVYYKIRMFGNTHNFHYEKIRINVRVVGYTWCSSILCSSINEYIHEWYVAGTSTNKNNALDLISIWEKYNNENKIPSFEIIKYRLKTGKAIYYECEIKEELK